MQHYPYAPGKSYPSTDLYRAYRLNYNTRQVSARPAASYRFFYKAPPPK